MPSAEAQKNHNELFPGRISTLAVTDPELIEYFDNWAFDDVVRDSELDTRTRLMVQLAAMIAAQAVAEYRVMLDAALTVGVTPVQAKEIVYQAVPYVGMAKVFDFLHVTNDVLTERGIELPLPGQSMTKPETRYERGLAVQRQIVGADRVDALYANAPADEQHIQFLSANCFGDHLTRGGIDVPTRELLTFAMLAALGGCEPQLAGHVAANRNVGNERGRLLDVLSQLLPYIGYPRTLNACASSMRSHPPRRENPRDVPDLADHRNQQRLRPRTHHPAARPSRHRHRHRPPPPCAWSLAPRPSPARWLPSAHASPISRPRPSSLPPPTTQPATSWP